MAPLAVSTDMDQLRSIEWGKTWLWEVRFTGEGAPPTPFNDWFPAVEVTENLFACDPLDIQYFNSKYQVPLSTSFFTIRVAFLDDINHTLESWIRDWVNKTIFPGNWTATLEECTRILQVIKLTNLRKPLKSRSYLVFPRGTVDFVGNTNPEVPRLDVEFVAVHILDERYHGEVSY